MSTAPPRGVQVASGSVYHYTDAGGLLGMLNNKVLWASEAAGLNDRAEIRQGWAKIRDWLDRQAGSDAIDLLRDHAANPVKDTHEVFILSASTHGDDANQWRLYANGGRGYAVELDTGTPLAVSTDIEVPEPHAGRVSWEEGSVIVEVSPWLHVLYDDSQIHNALELLADDLEKELAKIKAANSPEEGLQVWAESAFNWSYDQLAQIAHLIKEQGFAGEREVRVVTTFFFADEHLKYRAGAYGIVGYAELITSPLGLPSGIVVKAEKVDLPICSVRIGPLLQPDHTSSVRNLLRKHELRNVTVTASEVPLR